MKPIRKDEQEHLKNYVEKKFIQELILSCPTTSVGLTYEKINRKVNMEYIIYSVVEIDFHWGSDEPRPSILHTYADFKEAVTKKDLCKQIALLDKSRKQYQVVSIKVDNGSKKTD